MSIQTGSLTAMEHDWYATRSTATINAPLGDHKHSYYVTKGFGGDGKTLSQMESEWLANVGSSTADTPYELWVNACQAQSVTVGVSVNDCKRNFFNTIASGTNP